MTDRRCPSCNGRVHAEDRIEGECPTPGCSDTLDRLRERTDFATWTAVKQGDYA